MRMAQNDSSGSSLVVKARLGEDVRKVQISHYDVTLDEILLMMQRIFKGRLSANDNVTLKYKDDDGDLITINDDVDLAFAIHCHGTLKLTIFVNDHPKPLENDELKHVREELKHIRDVTTRLLDQLEPKPHVGSGEHLHNGVSEVVKEPSPAGMKGVAMGGLGAAEQSQEFDPLSMKQQFLQQPPTPTSGDKPPSVYGMGNQEVSRPDTPNSQSSLRRDQGLNDSMSQQENVATIQPTIHQQVNAGHNQQNISVMNGPPPPNSAPTNQTEATPPPPPASHMFGGAPPPAPQQQMPQPAAMPPKMSQPQMPQQPGFNPPQFSQNPTPPPMSMGQPPNPASAPPPPGSHPQPPALLPPQHSQSGQSYYTMAGHAPPTSTWGGGPPQQQSYGGSGYPPAPQAQQPPPPPSSAPPPPSAGAPPPTSNYFATSQPGQQPSMAPPAMNGPPMGQQLQMGGPPAMVPPPMGIPAPPGGNMAPGVNPFARNTGAPQYVRPNFSGYQ